MTVSSPGRSFPLFGSTRSHGGATALSPGTAATKFHDAGASPVLTSRNVVVFGSANKRRSSNTARGLSTAHRGCDAISAASSSRRVS